MADAGLRRSELLGPELDDVDLSRRLLRVRKAKGGRQRTTPIHPALVPLLAEAGVNERKRVTPHTLRHVFASELLHAGANLSQIQELLGHKHLDSTQRYTRVNAHELRGAIKRLRVGWRASGSPSTLSAMSPETRRRWRDYPTTVAPSVAPRPKATRKPGRYQDRCHFLTGRIPMAAGWTARIMIEEER
jgi:hypothetical protein